MACECTNTYRLGCYYCGQPGILMPFDAPTTGEYTVYFRYFGQVIEKRITAVAGGQLIVPIGGLNENFKHVFWILDPNDDQVTAVIDTVEYDCFSFLLKPSSAADPGNLDLSGIACQALLDALSDAQRQCFEDEFGGSNCPVTVVVSVDGGPATTVSNLDPCADNTINITLT